MADYAYLYSADSNLLIDHGILWSAIGVGALLLGLVIERFISWRRQSGAAKVAAPEKPATVSTQVVHEDDAALASLLKEANERLAEAQRSNQRPRTLTDFPWFLVVGSEGSGKTAVVQNSGIEPSLLAGQVLGCEEAITSTRVANIWLAGQSIFLEVSGRVFGSDPERLGQFIGQLQSGGTSGAWNRWLQMFRKPVSIRGLILCVDSRDFAGTSEPSTLDRAAQKIRERLLAIAVLFGQDFQFT